MLLLIIHQYILLRTTTYSDQWMAYNSIANDTIGLGKGLHSIVNCLVNSVDPIALVHTQNIENG